jgi:hypothetical protein
VLPWLTISNLQGGREVMDYRIEAFLMDVLLLEGENSKVVRDSVRLRLAECEKVFRDAESDKRMKDKAAQSCRALCRTRLIEEIHRRRGTRAAEHLMLVLDAIEQDRHV